VKRKSRGYWKSWPNLEREIGVLIARLGHFPSQKELAKMRRTDVWNAIRRHHGGFTEVRRKMGYQLPQKPPGWWDSKDNFEKELRLIIDELGHFPTYRDLRNLGRLDIANAIPKHGGIAQVRKQMGYTKEPKMPLSSVLSRGELRRLYEEEQMSLIEIATLKHIDPKTVKRYIQLYDIEPRSRSEVKKAYYSKHDVWNKGKAKIQPNLEPSVDLAYILGVLKGDGYVTGKVHPKICLEQEDPRFAMSFEGALKRIGLNPSTYPVKRRGLLRTAAQADAFSHWYKGLGLRDIEEIVSKRIEFIIAFIRGFYESEGMSTIDVRKKTKWLRWRIMLFNTDLQLIKMVHRLLTVLGFRFGLRWRFVDQRLKLIKGYVVRSRKPILYHLESADKKRNWAFMAVVQPCIKNKTPLSETAPDFK